MTGGTPLVLPLVLSLAERTRRAQGDERRVLAHETRGALAVFEAAGEREIARLGELLGHNGDDLARDPDVAATRLGIAQMRAELEALERSAPPDAS